MTGSLGPDDSRPDGDALDRAIDDALRAVLRGGPGDLRTKVLARLEEPVDDRPSRWSTLLRPAMLPAAGAVLIVARRRGQLVAGGRAAAQGGSRPPTGWRGQDRASRERRARSREKRPSLDSRRPLQAARRWRSPSPAEGRKPQAVEPRRPGLRSLPARDGRAEPPEGDRRGRNGDRRRGRTRAVSSRRHRRGPRRPDQADSQASPGRDFAHRHDSHRRGAHRGCAAGFNAGHAGQHALERQQFPGSDRSRQVRRSPSMNTSIGPGPCLRVRHLPARRGNARRRPDAPSPGVAADRESGDSAADPDGDGTRGDDHAVAGATCDRADPGRRGAARYGRCAGRREHSAAGDGTRPAAGAAAGPVTGDSAASRTGASPEARSRIPRPPTSRSR